MNSKSIYRIAFCGPSGSGKTTLARWLSEVLEIPLNPIGSRSVSRAMGFETPYDVDKAGLRMEFQRRLQREKLSWERERSSFVTDRSFYDELVYTTMHDAKGIDQDYLDGVLEGMTRYTHLVYCPVSAFCKVGEDPARVKDMTYHRIFDMLIKGLYRTNPVADCVGTTLFSSDLEERKERLRQDLNFSTAALAREAALVPERVSAR